MMGHAFDDVDGNWSYPIIHVLHTRFMQQQSDLVELAKARLVLFRTFCLGSIVHQTIWEETNIKATSDSSSPPILWLIKTDPNLDPHILKELLDMVRPYPFIYVIATNTNYGIGSETGGWRDGKEGREVLSSSIYTGNVMWLKQAYHAREKHAVAETRLDADDGLHIQFFSTIQQDISARLVISQDQQIHHPRLKWRYWCVENHLAWTPSPPFATTNATSYGMVLPWHQPYECITPGITVALSAGERQDSVPRFMHHKLFKQIMMFKNHTGCGSKSNSCLKMINQDPLVGAIRSRTPTSAGMKNVARKEEDVQQMAKKAISSSDTEMAHIMDSSFHVNFNDVILANQYVHDHFPEILKDNLKGQCTAGHSCKKGTKESLEYMLERVKNTTAL